MADEHPELGEMIESFVQQTLTRPGMMMVDYVVIAAVKGWDDDGDEVTAVYIHSSGAAYAIRGLLNEGIVRLDADLLDRYREE
jgi:hypothetical protein